MDLNVTFTTDVVKNDNVSDPTGFVKPDPYAPSTFQAEPDVGTIDGPGILDQLDVLETEAGSGVITPRGGGGGSGY